MSKPEFRMMSRGWRDILPFNTSKPFAELEKDFPKYYSIISCVNEIGLKSKWKLFDWFPEQKQTIEEANRKYAH